MRGSANIIGWIVAGLAIVAGAGVSQAAEGDIQSPSAYVVLGIAGAASARLITRASTCPDIVIDGKARPMTIRAGAGTMPLRPTQSKPENSKPSVFDVITCEAAIPISAHSASINGEALPLPAREARRIVVIGDTGCRLKASENAFQACNDPRQYRFAAIAARAAAWKPDLVVHVGDYLYRENPCPAGNAGCAGTPWGYGRDAWDADFFTPAAPLLRAAPWIVVRGNHENCTRAGQGWWRFLDPRPLETARDCNDPARDQIGDTSAPYAIPIGGRAQIIVLDLAISGTKPIGQDDYRFAPFRDSYVELDRLVGQADYNIVAGHKPILAISGGEKPGTLDDGTGGIQSVFQTLNPLLLPAGVDVLLSGHVHVWEQLSFSSSHPTQFITGFSGTQEDRVPLPAKPPANVAPGPGAIVDAFSSWVDGFGYMTMERKGPTSWKVKVWSVDGKVVNRCQIEGRRSSCRYAQVDTAIH